MNICRAAPNGLARYSAHSGRYFILVTLDAECHRIAAAEAEGGDAAL